jgi:mRNA interferase RelE/StbE
LKRLVFSSQAQTDLDALDRPLRLRIAAALQHLVQTNTGNIKKLQGVDPPEYRLRVGDFRVRFSYRPPGTIRVNRILNRKDAYR